MHTRPRMSGTGAISDSSVSPTRQNSRSALYTSPTKDQDGYQDCGKRRETIQDACRPLAGR